MIPACWCCRNLPARRTNSAPALLVNPYDPGAVGAAIARAIAMPKSERIARHAELYAALLRNDLSKWSEQFLKALGRQERKSDGEKSLNGLHDLPWAWSARIVAPAHHWVGGSWPNMPASNTATSPRPSSTPVLRAMAAALGARHQPEAIDDGKAHHASTSTSLAPSTPR